MKSKRQHEIMQLLYLKQNLSISEMVEAFGVSVETIRRDINDLEREGLLQKAYGGVTLAESAAVVPGIEFWNQRLAHCHEEKVKIAKKALAYIPDNITIALDIGTTTYELARLLSQKADLIIITSSMKMAVDLPQNTTHRVYAVGGSVMTDSLATVGIFARTFLNNFSAIDMFIGGAEGLTLEDGVTEFHEELVDIKRVLIQKAAQTVILTDYSKFGKKALFQACAVGDIDVLVTDNRAPKDMLHAIRGGGTEVVIAD